MSGTISLSSDARWSAASWLFDWVLEALSNEAKDAELVAALTQIVDENIGWLSLSDLTESQGAEVRMTIRESLTTAAEQGFPSTMPGRADALKHLGELVRLAAETA